MGTSSIEEKSNVIVVDDDYEVREGLTALIESVGLDCQVYSSPKEFLQRSPTNGPTCIILDVRLPGMNGLELQMELARDSKSPPNRARLKQEQSFDQLRCRFQNLSERERQVLPLVTAGLLNKQIAAEMGLSEVTVKVHRHKLMVKLQAKSLPELVRMADILGVWRTSIRERVGKIAGRPDEAQHGPFPKASATILQSPRPPRRGASCT